MHELLNMKKKLIYALMLAFGAFGAVAQQTFIYNQNFENYSSFSAPNDWTNTVPGMGVYPGRGVNASKGLDRNYNANARRDSITSPVMGVVAPNSKLSFKYRIVDYIGNIGVKHVVDPGDEIVVYMVDSVASTEVYRINTNNHVDTSAFAEVIVDLQAFVGRSVRVRFSVTRGTSSLFDFNANFDEVALYFNPITTGLKETEGIFGASLSPNPADALSTLRFNVLKDGHYTIRVFDAQGRLVQELPSLAVLAGTQQFQLLTASWKPGIYFCQLSSDKGQETVKLVVKH